MLIADSRASIENSGSLGTEIQPSDKLCSKSSLFYGASDDVSNNNDDDNYNNNNNNNNNSSIRAFASNM
jgi:hypothetical protein